MQIRIGQGRIFALDVAGCNVYRYGAAADSFNTVVSHERHLNLLAQRSRSVFQSTQYRCREADLKQTDCQHVYYPVDKRLHCDWGRSKVKSLRSTIWAMSSVWGMAAGAFNPCAGVRAVNIVSARAASFSSSRRCRRQYGAAYTARRAVGSYDAVRTQEYRRRGDD